MYIGMNGGDLDFPDEQLLSCLDMTNTQSNCSFDIDDFLVQTQTCSDTLDLMAHTDGHGRTQACTHAHACSPSGPDKTHTHTCIHVHTQIMPNTDEIQPATASEDTSESVDLKAKKRPSGNREAVRKYRERKKAKAASLEDEVVKLRAINQQLTKRLKNQALLEAEVCRLKCLLVDIRGRIEGEIGSFPYKNPVKSGDVYQKLDNLNKNNNNNLGGTYAVNSCNVYQGLSDCELEDLQCLGNQKSCPNEISVHGLGYVNNVSTRNNSNCGKRKWACAATAS